MSQSILQTSFELDASESEIALILEAIAALDAIESGAEPAISNELHAAFHQETHDGSDRLQGLREIVESTGGTSLLVKAEREGDEGPLLIFGMENAEVAALGEVIRVTCPSALPMSFTFSFSDDKPNAGAFGGGVVMIHPDYVDIENTTTATTRFIEETTKDVPLTEMQKLALEAYDGEHGDTLLRIEDRGYNAVKRMAYDGQLADGLALFVLGEVSDAGEDPEEGARMMRSAMDQLEDVAIALEQMAEDAAAKKTV